jgi:hypothetical protein
MDKLTQELRDFVAEILEEEKKPEAIDRVVAALENYKNEIETLQSEVATKDEELTAKDTELETLKEEHEALKIKFEELQTEKATLAEEKAQVDEKLESIEKDKVAHNRVTQLVEAKLIKEDEETVSRYLEKIRDKEDADFEAYVQELTEIKETILADLEAAKEQEENKTEDDNSKKLSDPVMAALNIEVQPTPDLKEKYAKMWANEDK